MKDVKIALFERYYFIDCQYNKIMEKVNNSNEVKDRDLQELNLVSYARANMFGVISDSDLKDEYVIWKENKEN